MIGRLGSLEYLGHRIECFGGCCRKPPLSVLHYKQLELDPKSQTYHTVV